MVAELYKIVKIHLLVPFKKVKVKVAQSCPTLGDPMGWGPPGSSVHGILQARILEWEAVSFFRGSSQPRARTQVSHIAGGFLTDSHRGSPHFKRMTFGLVHGDDPERCYREGGGRGIHVWERMYTRPWWIHVNVWLNQYSIVK